MNKIILLVVMISTYALASEVGHEGATDIVQRTVNFLLFAGLVWYLVGEPVKNYFASRSQSIADELKKVQDRLDESIALKKDALAKISDAEKFASELSVLAKKENKLFFLWRKKLFSINKRCYITYNALMIWRARHTR